jgi:lambda family phage portal protein
MSLRSRIAAWLDPVRRAPTVARHPLRLVRRGYAGAEIGPLTNSFRSEHSSLNQVLEAELRTLVGRSRQLAKNNDYVKHFLRQCQNHIAGPRGFMLAVNCLRDNGSIDEADKLVCEQAFARWAKRGVCDVTGRLSFVQLQRLLVLCLARDGEFLVRRVQGKKFNDFGYALQVIDPVLLDHTYRADLPNGHRIRMGVEVDTWGRPVAYHLLTDTELIFGSSQRRERVPAAQIWHYFLQEEPTQVRGVPWIHSAMRRLNDLGGFEEAAIIAARVGASQMGFYVPPVDQAGDASKLADEVLHGKDSDGQEQQTLVKDATPGTFEELPPGYDFKSFDPDYPHQNYDPFVKAMLRGISSGLGTDYPTLSNNLEGVNYTSIRAGKLDVQDLWMCLQGGFAEGFHEPLWPEWLQYAFAADQMGRLPVSKFEKYTAAIWQGRRWVWVDPLKEAQARALELDRCLTSYSQVMRDLGRDPEATWRELEKDKARLSKLLSTPPAKSTDNAGGSASAPKEKDEEDED